MEDKYLMCNIIQMLTFYFQGFLEKKGFKAFQVRQVSQDLLELKVKKDRKEMQDFLESASLELLVRRYT